MANTNTDKDLLHPREALKILDSLTEANQFCSYGACPLELPGLEIAPVGEVSLPITATSAKQLIKVANQAPYGRGEETIVDTEVRNVWQLEPHQVEFRNPRWNAVIEEIAKRVQKTWDCARRSKVAFTNF